MTKMLATHISFRQLNLIKIVVIALFLGLIVLSPSLKVIPTSLIATSFHDNQRLVELCLIGCTLLLSAFSKSPLSTFKPNEPANYAACALIALAITSSAFAASPRHALIEACVFAGLVCLALNIKNLYCDNPSMLTKQLVYTFWASILLFMLSFYTGYITATIFNTPVTWPNPLTGFSNIRYFNQYQLWTFGLVTLPLLAFELKNTSTRAFLNLGLIAWAVLLFFSASRGALLALCLSGIVTIVIYKKVAWPFIRLQLKYISLGYIGYQILFVLIPYLTGSAVVIGSVMRDTTSDRLALWSQAIQLAENNPIFGVGPMHFAWFSSTYAHPHNSVLQLMCEWGIPATLIILGIAGYGLCYWLKKVNIKHLASGNQLNQHLGIALFFTITTSAIYSLVDGVIVMPISQVMMFTAIGLMMGYASEKTIAVATTRTAVIKPIFLGIVLITLIRATLPEILQSASGSEKRFSIGYLAAGPRLWYEVKPTQE